MRWVELMLTAFHVSNRIITLEADDRSQWGPTRTDRHATSSTGYTKTFGTSLDFRLALTASQPELAPPFPPAPRLLVAIDGLSKLEPI